jgi:hypothetical protein
VKARARADIMSRQAYQVSGQPCTSSSGGPSPPMTACRRTSAASTYRLANVSENPAGRLGAPDTEPGPCGVGRSPADEFTSLSSPRAGRTARSLIDSLARRPREPPGLRPGLLATSRLQRRGSPAQSLAAQSWVALEQSSTCSVVARRSRRYSVSRSSSLSTPRTSSSTAASASSASLSLAVPAAVISTRWRRRSSGDGGAQRARRSRGRSRAPPGWSCRSGAWPPVPAGRSRRDRAAASGRRDCADAARALRAQLGHALASGAPDGRAARKNDCAKPESWWQERWVKSR